MTQKIRLSESQKKVIKAMREGNKMEQCTFFNSPVKIKNDTDFIGKTVSKSTFSVLLKNKLIFQAHYDHPNMIYALTTFGRAISLD